MCFNKFKLFYTLFPYDFVGGNFYQVVIFPFGHYFFLFLSMIRIAYEVKNTMDHYPLQLFIKILPEFIRIFFNPVDTDENITGNYFRLLLIRESKNICQDFVLKVSPVKLQEVVVAAKNEIDVPGSFLFFPDDRIQPFSGTGFILKCKRNVFTEKLDRETHILGIKPLFFAY